MNIKIAIANIKTPDNYSDLMVIGYRAEEIARNIKVKKFIENDDVSIIDFLKYSRKIVAPGKFSPKPLYISPSQSLFAKYKGPTILDNPIDAS